MALVSASASAGPTAQPPRLRRAVFLVDPVVIAVTGLALGGAVVLLAGPSLQVVATAAAVVAGWSSAWSP